jgi:hypothetical protein
MLMSNAFTFPAWHGKLLIIVEERCTCGTVLAENAMFCHRCGRPTRPLTDAPPEEPEPVSPAALDSERLRAAAAQIPPEIGFQNAAAVRVAAMIAALGTLMGLLPVPSLLSIFWKLVTLVAAGFLAVYVYHRRTGDLPSVRGGARIGWMTGMFSFVIALVMFVAGAIALSSQGGLAEVFRKQLMSANSPSSELDEMLRILESPTGMAMLVTTLVMILFLLFTALPMIGGALGAKVLEKE